MMMMLEKDVLSNEVTFLKNMESRRFCPVAANFVSVELNRGCVKSGGGPCSIAF